MMKIYSATIITPNKPLLAFDLVIIVSRGVLDDSSNTLMKVQDDSLY
jgi:hypothetical protein